jgi:hypothetical protein
VTHLRFFTSRDLEAMARVAGLRVKQLDVVPSDSRSMNFALKVTRGRAKEFAAYQWHVIGVPDDTHHAVETGQRAT